MKKYLALLRGINVGGKNRVEMKRLRLEFENAGFINVATYINSGNIIFESEENSKSKIISLIKSVLRKTFDFEIPVLIRSRDNICALAKAIPNDWQNDTEQKTDVIFLWDDFADKKSLSLIKQTEGVDNVVYIDGAIVWNVKRSDYGRSGMNKFIGTQLYKNMTARNVNTVRKLAGLMN